MAAENCDIYATAATAQAAVKALDDAKFQACVPFMEASKQKFMVIYKT
ncbi:MAG: hypothetical protein Q8R70_05000 [Methanoregula sp.]|nr:hypothetical protein [Methanoregula sp.]